MVAWGDTEIVEVMVRGKRTRMVEGYRCSVGRVWGFIDSVWAREGGLVVHQRSGMTDRRETRGTR